MIAMAIMIFLLLAAVGYLLFKRSKQKSQTK
ncbi:LPXTG cell wall anchor domain-containing protein [Leuconostoc lactis]|nr:LPXTG cell wall anchor domain-containing protein [Leuconostoc lactis]